MNTWGEAYRLSIFGESHGEAVGIVIDGLPTGLPLDLETVNREMQRRAPGRSSLATARREADQVEIISGIYQGKAAGTPICGIIRNSDADSRHYDSRLRPGHADWTALIKYGGHADMRGGGHFSGRLTAGLVFAGSLAKQALARQGVEVFGRIARIGRVADSLPDDSRQTWQRIAALDFPAWQAEALSQEVQEAQQAGDSVGGSVEVRAFGVPGGLGEPFFGSMESSIASLLFSVPAIKSVEFGDGSELATMRGSQANDQLTVEDGRITALSNHNGGILGGISNGAPIVVRAAIKPTPSIAREQQSVDAATMQPTRLSIEGRHDPCVAVRAVPVIEAVVAICILDRLLVAARPQAFIQNLGG